MRTRSLAFGAPVFVRIQKKGHLGCSLKGWYMEKIGWKGEGLSRETAFTCVRENAREKGISFF